MGWRAALASLLMAVAAFGLLALDTVTVDEDGKAVPAVELSPLYRFAQYSLGTGLEAAFEGEAPPSDVAEAVDDLVAGPGDEESNSLAAYWPISAIFPLPILIAGFAFWTVHRGTANGRQLMFCLFGMFFASMMTGIFFLPALVALGFASFQVRKVEAAAALAARRAAEEGDGDVIDVDDVVDEGGAGDEVFEVDEVIEPNDDATVDDERR